MGGRFHYLSVQLDTVNLIAGCEEGWMDHYTAKFFPSISQT